MLMGMATAGRTRAVGTRIDHIGQQPVTRSEVCMEEHASTVEKREAVTRSLGINKDTGKEGTQWIKSMEEQMENFLIAYNALSHSHIRELMTNDHPNLIYRYVLESKMEFKGKQEIPSLDRLSLTGSGADGEGNPYSLAERLENDRMGMDNIGEVSSGGEGSMKTVMDTEDKGASDSSNIDDSHEQGGQLGRRGEKEEKEQEETRSD